MSFNLSAFEADVGQIHQSRPVACSLIPFTLTSRNTGHIPVWMASMNIDSNPLGVTDFDIWVNTSFVKHAKPSVRINYTQTFWRHLLLGLDVDLNLFDCASDCILNSSAKVHECILSDLIAIIAKLHKIIDMALHEVKDLLVDLVNRIPCTWRKNGRSSWHRLNC